MSRSRGLEAARQALERERQIQRLHRAGLAAAGRFAGQTGLRLNVGCGKNLKPGWINVDLERGADLTLDIREPLPFADGSVAEIYSEHFFEHLAYPDETAPFLAESLRVLQPEGLFGVGVPDLGETLHQYASGQLPALLEQWRRNPAYRDYFPPEVWATPMHFVNFGFRQWREHKYAYDLETLAWVLQQAGFAEVRKREFDPQRDSEDRREGTVYVDARKPVLQQR